MPNLFGGPSLEELAELWQSQEFVYETYTGPMTHIHIPYQTATVISDGFVTQPIAQGWECPKCGHVYAPSVALCLYCGPKQTVMTNTTNDPGTGGKP